MGCSSSKVTGDGNERHPAPSPRNGGVPGRSIGRTGNVDSQQEEGTTLPGLARTARSCLWDEAIASLTGPDRECYDALSKHLELLEHEDDIVKSITTAPENSLNRMDGTAGVSQSTTQRCIQRGTKFMTSTERVGMGVARLDPHGIAPLVLAGVYTLVKCIEGATEDQRIANRLTMEIPELITLWTSIEQRTIRREHSSNQEEDYRKLCAEIVKMYRVIVVLLGTLVKYFDDSWRRRLGAFVPRQDEWVKLKDEMKAHETNCNNIRSRLALVKEDNTQAMQTLNWVSSHDTRGAFKGVLDRTKVDNVYKSCLQWIVESVEFQMWRLPGASFMLWLKGTIGTGKTTIMARAILTIRASQMVEHEGSQFAMFVFKKARGKLATNYESALNTRTCLASITRQLAWDRRTSNVRPVVGIWMKEEGLMGPQSMNTSLTTEEHMDLLKRLLKVDEEHREIAEDVYIMIDGVDECEDCEDLLTQLKTLWTFAKEPLNNCKSLHIMLSARDDTPVENYFRQPDLLVVSTGWEKALEDQKLFIQTKIQERARTTPYSLIFASKKRFDVQLGEILNQKARGLFRWIEIQIDIFTLTNFVDARDIENDLSALEKRILRKGEELTDEYDRLTRILQSSAAWPRALKMLKLISSARWPLSVSAIAETVRVSDLATDEEDSIDAQYVQRVLAGFIFEDRSQAGKTQAPCHFGNDGIVELAHASVLEYLMENERTAAEFTTLSQHSEIAGLCFASISQLARSHDEIPKLTRRYLTNIREGRSFHSDMIMSSLQHYSCYHWPSHCRLALDEGDDPDLIKSIRDFILGPSYLAWNTAIGCGLNSAFRQDPMKFQFFDWRLDEIWHEGSQRKPGFVLACFNLVEVIELDEVRQLIGFNDVNGRGYPLLKACRDAMKRETIIRLINCCSGNIQWDKRGRYLRLAVTWRLPALAKRVLDSLPDDARHSGPLRDEIMGPIEQALLQSVRALCKSVMTADEVEEIAQIMKLLLEYGPYIWGTRARDPIMNSATAQQAQEVLIEYAKGLRIPGSVQRLLRARGIHGHTPMTAADPESLPHLQQQLREALDRDGKVMYDFGEIEIPAVRDGIVEEQSLLQALRARREGLKHHLFYHRDGVRMDAIAQYDEWYERRRAEIEAEYEAAGVSSNGHANDD